MPGPYTAFTYGDPAAIKVSAPPYISGRFRSLFYDDPTTSAVDVLPMPVGANLAGGTTGAAYSETISAQGGTSPYTFAVTAGSLPTSTTLNSSTGVISGTPTVAGTYTFTITVTDANGYTGSHVFQIVIAAPSAGGGSSFTFIA